MSSLDILKSRRPSSWHKDEIRKTGCVNGEKKTMRPSKRWQDNLLTDHHKMESNMVEACTILRRSVMRLSEHEHSSPAHKVK